VSRRGGEVCAGLAVIAALAAGGCRPAPEPRVAIHRLFGPVIGNEVIVGRADGQDGHISLLVGEQTLVNVDLEAASAVRHRLTNGGAACWGLARLADGSLWTLKGRSAVIRIGERGEILEELGLDAPQFGLFAQGDRLIFQPADFSPPAPLLYATRPGDATRTPFGPLRSRPFRLARASVAALNMLGCGIGRAGERPCWFPDEAALSLMDSAGGVRRVMLPGLEVIAPEVLLTSDNPAVPVRDAYIDASGTIWVLGSGTPPAGAEDQPGGWILARYSGAGARIGLQRLAESARLILRAQSGRAVLLTGTGMVAEVVP
jgi:hypothetical protein